MKYHLALGLAIEGHPIEARRQMATLLFEAAASIRIGESNGVLIGKDGEVIGTWAIDADVKPSKGKGQ